MICYIVKKKAALRFPFEYHIHTYGTYKSTILGPRTMRSPQIKMDWRMKVLFAMRQCWH